MMQISNAYCVFGPIAIHELAGINNSFDASLTLTGYILVGLREFVDKRRVVADFSRRLRRFYVYIGGSNGGSKLHLLSILCRKYCNLWRCNIWGLRGRPNALRRIVRSCPIFCPHNLE